MNTTIKSLIAAAFAVAALTATTTAQDADRPAPPEGGAPHARPVPPLLAALDANHDGVIDASEIANAANALKALDKNGDGQLTRDELRPEGRRGPGGPGGPGGPKGPKGHGREGRPHRPAPAE